jgi:hypothetical protein
VDECGPQVGAVGIPAAKLTNDLVECGRGVVGGRSGGQMPVDGGCSGGRDVIVEGPEAGDDVPEPGQMEGGCQVEDFVSQLQPAVRGRAGREVSQFSVL